MSPTFSLGSAKFVLKLEGIGVEVEFDFLGALVLAVLIMVSEECGCLGLGFESGTRVVLQPSLLNE